MDIPKAKLTEWADELIHMNHLGTLVQREIDAKHFARARELAERSRVRARKLLNQLFDLGADKPEGYAEPGTLGDYERAIAVVRAVIAEWDPYALLRGGAPANEFEAETTLITARLKTIHNADDAARVISSVFSVAFEAQSFSPKDCAEVGEKLYARLAEAQLLR